MLLKLLAGNHSSRGTARGIEDLAEDMAYAVWVIFGIQRPSSIYSGKKLTLDQKSLVLIVKTAAFEDLFNRIRMHRIALHVEGVDWRELHHHCQYLGVILVSPVSLLLLSQLLDASCEIIVEYLPRLFI